jgi:hypothetical protein
MRLDLKRGGCFAGRVGFQSRLYKMGFEHANHVNKINVFRPIPSASCR